MSRSLAGGFATAVDAAHLDAFPLVEMQLTSGTLYLSGTSFDVDWDGHTWQAALGLGTIEPVIETDTEQPGLSFTLSAVPSSAIALGLTEDVQGRTGIVRLAAVVAGALQVDTNCWQGLLDVMTIDDGADTAVVRVTAENQLIAWEEPAGLRMNEQDQRRLAPTDEFFEFQSSIVGATIVWPTRAAQEGA